ncbi:hypothetical protein, partial [Actinocorallia lasiicapitis]
MPPAPAAAPIDLLRETLGHTMTAAEMRRRFTQLAQAGRSSGSPAEELHSAVLAGGRQLCRELGADAHRDGASAT